MIVAALAARRPARAALATFLIAACNAPPAEQAAPLRWQTYVAELPEALLSVCAGADGAYAVGGSGSTGLALAATREGWQQEALPAGTDVLWWCWVDPAGGVWAVGERGTVIHRTDRWRAIDTASAGFDDTATLYGVWGLDEAQIAVVGATDAYGVTLPIVSFHVDGRWLPVDTDALPRRRLFKVWGASATDVWVVGDGGTMARYDGEGWQVHPTPTRERLIALWGTGPEEIFAVGGDTQGVVLRFDGEEVVLHARTPEPLSGVWTAAGAPLHVGGNRGFFARFGRDASGRVSTIPAVTVAAEGDLCVHAIAGAGESVLAAAADLLAGGTGRWRGALLGHGPGAAGFEGPLGRLPDAGPADARPDVDAGAGEDASLPGSGELCADGPPYCGSGLDCWNLLIDSFVAICTIECVDASGCTAFGPDACCARPGFQTLTTVCIPGDYGECNVARDAGQ